MALDPDLFNQVQAYRLQLKQHIKDYGWSIMGVPMEGTDEIDYAYSIGFWKTVRRPDLITSRLPYKVSHAVFSAMYDRAKRKQKLPTGVPIHDAIGSFTLFAFPVAKRFYPDVLNAGRAFYNGNDFECLQLVWPDKNGRFPWDDECITGYKFVQRDLSEHGWRAGLAQQ